MKGGGTMRLEQVDFPSGQPLTEAYIHQFAEVSGLYDYNPWDEADWKARAAWLDRERPAGADREQLADALRRFNEKAGNSAAALALIERLRDPGALCIVGGQQAGLLTGPLLVIHKAITIIQAARTASKRLDRTVLPVFWIAGEDHDFDEVNHAYVLSPEQQVEKLAVEHPGDARTSVSRLRFRPEQWASALEQLDKALLPTEYKPALLEKLQAYTLEASTLTDLFARILAELFGEYGLILVDSDDPAIRALERPMFQQLIEKRAGINEALHEARSQIEGLGYRPAAELNEQATNLFVFDDNGERLLLYRTAEEGVWSDRRGSRSFTVNQLLEWADAAPERLSNNVMTRPLMQDFLFPVLGAVLGGSEIAYWGLTRKAFHALGMRMPLLLPRISFTLVEGTVQKNMQKYGLTLEDVLYRLQEKQEAWLKEQDRLQLEDRFAELKQRFRLDYEPLIETISGINPGLKKLGETNLAKILEQIEFLENKSADAVRSQYESGLRQFQRVGLSAMPGGKLQERVYNVYGYLNKYGDNWLKELLSMELSIDGKHYACYM